MNISFKHYLYCHQNEYSPARYFADMLRQESVLINVCAVDLLKGRKLKREDSATVYVEITQRKAYGDCNA